MDASRSDDFRVRTNLGEVVSRRVEGRQPGEKPRIVERIRHAASERTPTRKAKPVEPIPSDRWTPPTVTARLRRMAAIYQRLQSRGIWPARVGSCMPEPVRSILSDYTPDPKRRRRDVTTDELDLADTTMRRCIAVFQCRPEHKAAFWGVALGWSTRECAEEAHAWDKLCRRMSHETMRQLMVEVRQELAEAWNARLVPVSAADVALAQSFHRHPR